MIRELGKPLRHARGAQLLERLADASVQAHPARLAQREIQGRLHERMRELVLVEPGFLDEPRVERPIEKVQRGVLVGVAHGAEEREVEMPADHRGRHQEILDLLGKLGDALRDHVADARRHRVTPEPAFA